MKRFLAIGECMVEMAPAGVDGQYQMGFAGDTFNTAWYMRQFHPAEADIAYFSAVGDDQASDQLTQFIKDAGITPELKVLPGKPVGLYMISLDNGERSFSYWRSTSAARHLADGLEDLPGLSDGDIAYFSGITVAILSDEARASLFAALDRARAKGVQVVFDPNLRPKLWDNDEQMCHWTMEASKHSDLALPSFEDEATYFGDADPEATAQRYAKVGVATCIVKNGAEAVLCAQGDTRDEIATIKAKEVVDTTAAGDSFNAGFLAGLAVGKPLTDAVKQGCEVAVKVIGARGALVQL